MQVVDGLDHTLVHALDDEATVDARILQCSAVHLDHLQAIRDVELLHHRLRHGAELCAEHVDVSLLDRLRVALGVLQRDGLLDLLLVAQIRQRDLVARTLGVDHLPGAPTSSRWACRPPS